MSATLGALVIAIATEFSVILSARYERERKAGSVGRRSGAPTCAPGPRSSLWVTAIAGFAVLAIAGLPPCSMRSD